MVPAWVCAAWGAAAGGSSGRSLQAGRVRRRRAGGQLQRRAPLALPAAPGGRGGGPVFKCHCCSWCCPKRAGEHAARVVRARVDGIRCRTALQAMLQVWVPERPLISQPVLRRLARKQPPNCKLGLMDCLAGGLAPCLATPRDVAQHPQHGNLLQDDGPNWGLPALRIAQLQAWADHRAMLMH